MTNQYGIVGVGEPAAADSFHITSLVEKPKPTEAPSNLYINGRYILQPEIFEHLAKFQRGAGGEIQLTDAMIEVAKTQSFFGWRFHGHTFDCGSKTGFLAANIAYALRRPDISADVKREIGKLRRALRASLVTRVAGTNTDSHGAGSGASASSCRSRA